uniref:CTP synthase UTPammonia ligase n=1 Tax=Rhizophora mucronata TaxID=61149 RepID=A0A2P2NIW2_RHIMU
MNVMSNKQSESTNQILFPQPQPLSVCLPFFFFFCFLLVFFFFPLLTARGSWGGFMEMVGEG